MDSIQYPHNPINSLKALSRALGVEEVEISNALQDIRYTEAPLKKKDGSVRITYDAEPKLKTIQKRITCHIFQKVKFPRYINGCIRDTETPRNIYTNASPHAGKKHIILCDIKNFFPSITVKIVYSIFRECLGYSPDVSSTLTKLCTYDGFLPQGASPSSYIANLAFWDIEPLVVEKLKQLGFTYTRFADDITVSTDKPLSPRLKTQVLSEIRRAIRKRNCSLKKSKTMVLKRGQAIKGIDQETKKPKNISITVTSLSIHHKNVTISKQERKRVRACVHRLESTDMNKLTYQEWCRKYSSAMGRVSRLISCGHKEGEPLKQRLKELKKAHRSFHQRSSNVSGRK